MCGVSDTRRTRSKSSEIPSQRRSVAIVRAWKRTGRRPRCAHCLVEFEPKAIRNAIYCSRDCYLGAKISRSRFRRVGKVEAKLLAGMCECMVCGLMFRSHVKKKYCSTDCSRSAQREIERVRYYGANVPTCIECGEPRDTSQKHNRYCSEKCRSKREADNKRRGKQRRRAAKKHVQAEVFNSDDVFSRDRWRCQRCGRKCLRRFSHSHLDRSPTLDHIIPLSKGGPHTLANCQLLCWACNSNKGDKIGGDQLRIDYG